MNLRALFILLILPVAATVFADTYADEDAKFGPLPEGCTSIMVGRLASIDGSVMTSHTCDGRYRTWMEIVKGKKHKKDSKAKIYKGRMHTEFPSDMRGISVKGEIPQVEETYTILDTAYPCMNEHQLAMGESTFGGRRELQSKKGLFYVEELQRIALERTKTARDAIKLMGSLAEKYGYVDSGECITVADPNEVWHMEIMGPGKGNTGAVWAAVRIPDDHVGVAANICRISTLDLNNKEYYMASNNVFSLAEKMKWWDPKSETPFKFWKAYSGRKPFRLREWWVLNTAASSLKLDYFKLKELPFSVKPDNKVSVKNLFNLFRETYEGTKYALNDKLVVKKAPPRKVKPKSKVEKKEDKKDKKDEKKAEKKTDKQATVKEEKKDVKKVEKKETAKAAKKEIKKEAKPVDKIKQARERLVKARLKEESIGLGNDLLIAEAGMHAHPWLGRDQQEVFNRLKPGTVSFYRPIPVMFNAYHTVIQLRNWLPDPVGGICWIGYDNPAASPRGPIFCGNTELPADFKVDNHYKYRTDCAAWAYRRASRLAILRWGKNKSRIQKIIMDLEDQALSDLPGLEERVKELYQKDPKKAKELLTRYSLMFLDSMTHRFWRLGDELWMDYMFYL